MFRIGLGLQQAIDNTSGELGAVFCANFLACRRCTCGVIRLVQGGRQLRFEPGELVLFAAYRTTAGVRRMNAEA